MEKEAKERQRRRKVGDYDVVYAEKTLLHPCFKNTSNSTMSLALRGDDIALVKLQAPGVAVGSQTKFPLLDTVLGARSAFLLQCWNKPLTLDGPDGVVALLLREREDWADSKDASKGAGTALNDGDLLGSGLRGTRLTDGALRRAILEDKGFVSAADQIVRLDSTVEKNREEAIEIACLAKCAIFQRFFANPDDLMRRGARPAPPVCMWAAVCRSHVHG